MDKSEIIQKYFNVALKIKKRDDEFGISKELAYQLIGSEFNVVSQEIQKRHFDSMVLAKFLIAGSNGIKASSTIKTQYDDWEKKQM